MRETQQMGVFQQPGIILSQFPEYGKGAIATTNASPAPAFRCIISLDKQKQPPLYFHLSKAIPYQSLWPFSREEEIVSVGRICYQYGNFDVTNAGDGGIKCSCEEKDLEDRTRVLERRLL
jgi:hypothetical protein